MVDSDGHGVQQPITTACRSIDGADSYSPSGGGGGCSCSVKEEKDVYKSFFPISI
jgi:hypothetical protein